MNGGLLNEAASHLAGRPVRVYLDQAPASSMAMASARRVADNLWVIRLAPGLSPAEALRYLCHECAHVRLHGLRLPVSKEEPPRSRRTTEGDIKRHEADPWETEADALADRWYKMILDRFCPIVGEGVLAGLLRTALQLSI